MPISGHVFGWSLLSNMKKEDFIDNCFYRPQRSWGKVIFSEACVNNSVHGGGMRGCSGGCTWLLGGHAWLHRGGMHGFIWGGMRGFIRGVHGFIRGCMVLFGGCMVLFGGDLHGFIWGACVVLFGGCMVLFGGHAWFYLGGACVVFSVFSDTMRYGQ